MKGSSTMKDNQSIWTALVDVAFEQNWVDVDGIKTRYARAGNKGNPPVLMLHGTAGSWETFSRNLGALSRHYDCYAIDMVGCGFTSKPDTPYETEVYARHALAFLSTMQLNDAHWVGCSLGSWVAARAALLDASKVRSLTMLSAAGYFSNAKNMNRIKGARTKAVDDPSWENIKPIFDHLIHEEVNRIPDIISVRQRVYQQADMAQAMQNILCLQDAEIREKNLLSDNDWCNIHAPALVIGSLADKDEYLETARIVSELMPQAVYQEMQNVGHWPHFEDAESFNQIYLEFLQGK